MMGANDTETADDWDEARRAAGGDTSAFGRLYERHSPDLYKFLASRLGQTDAEDALSEVWMKVWRAISGTHAETHFRGWIFQIARNEVIDRVRRQKRRGTETLPDDPPASNETNLPDVALELQQREADIRDCVNHLPHEYADVVSLHLQGEDHGVIAEKLNIPMGTSYSRLHKAKPLLKTCMERKGWTA